MYNLYCFVVLCADTNATERSFVCELSSYRLAPEFPYPVPFDDCVRATLHFLQHASDMNVDATRVAIAGICSAFFLRLFALV